MTNAEKRYLTDLEMRVYRLETVIQSLRDGLQWSTHATPPCSQCNMIPYDNMTCSMPDCCQGRNPADDE